MLKADFSYLKYVFLLVGVIVAKLNATEAPILDIENESVGYVGTIGERNVLVDLKPHLQIKNIDSINGICSYHVFKPTSEEFPFTIDIKDKTTGEAVIEVIRKESDVINKDAKHKYTFLDCNKRKEYDFLIQAHDCSTPSIPSNKVPVKIEVIDHDDYVLKFEHEGPYKNTLIESDEIYENFMTIRARDNDCTNDGFACTYKLLTQNLIPVEALYPFKIDQTGHLSTLRSIKKGENFDFIVRAFDCLNNKSFVDAAVSITVNEPCVPQWSDYQTEIHSAQENTKIFTNLKSTTCNQNDLHKSDSQCKIDTVTAKLSLILDQKIINKCEKCSESVDASPKTNRINLFNGGIESSNEDIDSVEDDDDDDDDDDENDVNKILSVNKASILKEPLNYQSFSKGSTTNAKKINFNGNFGNEFTLSAWIRRPANADKTIKEQILCGTDSKSLNRHHFGLYFYRGNLKFLLRREPSEHKSESKQDLSNQDSSNIDSNEAFYPSLWEWSMYEPILSDSKWHFYEIKFNYPNASLYIDGVKFVENNTNSDIIDAYELNESGDTGSISTYIGACYHARTQSLTDTFEGDIGNVVLIKKNDKKNLDQEKLKCKKSCDEFIDSSSVSTENYLHSIETSNLNELTIKASNLDEMSEIIKNINYVNKESNPQVGSRSIKLATSIHCANNGKNIEMHDVEIKLNVKHQITPEYRIVIQGDKQLTVSKLDLENGFEPFKDILISKSLIGDVESAESDENSLESTVTSTDQSKMLSKCQIKIIPDRNLMTPNLNNEKVMFLQNLLDEYNFKFEETLNSVIITGVQSLKNYENFIRHLTYVVININEVDSAKLDLIKSKQFLISCTSAETKLESNVITIRLVLGKLDTPAKAEAQTGPVAHKKLQSFVVSENDDDIIQRKIDLPLSSSKNNAPSSPMVFALLVMASCAIGFILVFGAIKFYTSRVIGKRKPLPNEENPQMEWDDSGLNITENPLETLEINKETGQVVQHSNLEYEEDEYSSYEDEDEDDDEYNEDEQYTSEEEPGIKVVDRELEWDDTSLEIKLKDKQLQKQLSKSNKSTTSNYIDPNQFV